MADCLDDTPTEADVEACKRAANTHLFSIPRTKLLMKRKTAESKQTL